MEEKDGGFVDCSYGYIRRAKETGKRVPISHYVSLARKMVNGDIGHREEGKMALLAGRDLFGHDSSQMFVVNEEGGRATFKEKMASAFRYPVSQFPYSGIGLVLASAFLFIPVPEGPYLSLMLKSLHEGNQCQV